MCGGTLRRRRRPAPVVGLSPRVRGNLRATCICRSRIGSIPACAGEPSSITALMLSMTVYPRVCGGTESPYRSKSTWSGLSPRVRGNRRYSSSLWRGSGSIPACAGEPLLRRILVRIRRVYPRVCGGTCAVRSRSSLIPGLSPRVRGNRRGSSIFAQIAGSIPACAGEPCTSRRKRRPQRVYPRVCGGTPKIGRFGSRRWGLSPRVRGNPERLGVRARVRGSIPACAGEPMGVEWSCMAYRVYPRVCGGTPGRAV